MSDCAPNQAGSKIIDRLTLALFACAVITQMRSERCRVRDRGVEADAPSSTAISNTDSIKSHVQGSAMVTTHCQEIGVLRSAPSLTIVRACRYAVKLRNVLIAAHLQML